MMDDIFKGDFAQSVTIHHYEKWINIEFVHYMAKIIEKQFHNDDINNGFLEALQQFTLNLLKEVNSHIHDLSIQQHATTSFSLAETTLRNCLVYTLSRDVQLILRIFESELSEWERQQIYTVNVTNLAATLHMLYEHENQLPCILQTKNIREIFDETFNPYL